MESDATPDQRYLNSLHPSYCTIDVAAPQLPASRPPARRAAPAVLVSLLSACLILFLIKGKTTQGPHALESFVAPAPHPHARPVLSVHALKQPPGLARARIARLTSTDGPTMMRSATSEPLGITSRLGVSAPLLGNATAWTSWWQQRWPFGGPTLNVSSDASRVALQHLHKLKEDMRAAILSAGETIDAETRDAALQKLHKLKDDMRAAVASAASDEVRHKLRAELLALSAELQSRGRTGLLANMSAAEDAQRSLDAMGQWLSAAAAAPAAAPNVTVNMTTFHGMHKEMVRHTNLWTDLWARRGKWMWTDMQDHMTKVHEDWQLLSGGIRRTVFWFINRALDYDKVKMTYITELKRWQRRTEEQWKKTRAELGTEWEGPRPAWRRAWAALLLLTGFAAFWLKGLVQYLWSVLLSLDPGIRSLVRRMLGRPPPSPPPPPSFEFELGSAPAAPELTVIPALRRWSLRQRLRQRRQERLAERPQSTMASEAPGAAKIGAPLELRDESVSQSWRCPCCVPHANGKYQLQFLHAW